MKIKLPLTLFCLFLISCEKGDIEIFDSKPIFSSSLNGEWILVNYWADWCPPCIKEMPELESFYKQNKSKALVLAYNFDRLEGEELRDQIERFKVNVPSILTDPGLLFGWSAPPSLPATYIITPDGNLVETLIGPQTKDSLEEIISKHEKSL